MWKHYNEWFSPTPPPPSPLPSVTVSRSENHWVMRTFGKLCGCVCVCRSKDVSTSLKRQLMNENVRLPLLGWWITLVLRVITGVMYTIWFVHTFVKFSCLTKKCRHLVYFLPSVKTLTPHVSSPICWHLSTADLFTCKTVSNKCFSVFTNCD